MIAVSTTDTVALLAVGATLVALLAGHWHRVREWRYQRIHDAAAAFLGVVRAMQVEALAITATQDHYPRLLTDLGTAHAGLLLVAPRNTHSEADTVFEAVRSLYHSAAEGLPLDELEQLERKLEEDLGHFLRLVRFDIKADSAWRRLRQMTTRKSR